MDPISASLNLPELEKQYGLPSGLLSSVMGAESGGNPDALSPAGAIGLFQFLPTTAQQYGIDPSDPKQAAFGAANMFADLSKKYNGDIPSMLAAYNWGQGNLDKNGIENAPKETRNYIQNVMNGLQRTQYADVQPNTIEKALGKVGDFLVSPARAEETDATEQPISQAEAIAELKRRGVSLDHTPESDVKSDIENETAPVLERKLVWDERGTPSYKETIQNGNEDENVSKEEAIAELERRGIKLKSNLQAPETKTPVAVDVAKTIASSALPTAANIGAAAIPGVGPAVLAKGALDFALAGAKAAGQTKTAANIYAKLTGQEPISDEDYKQYQDALKSGNVSDTFENDYLPAKISNAIGYPSTWAHKLQDLAGLDYAPQTAAGNVVGQTAEGASLFGKNALAAIAPMLAGSAAGQVAEKAEANPLVQWLAQAAGGTLGAGFHKPIQNVAGSVAGNIGNAISPVVNTVKSGLSDYAEMFNKTAKTGKNTSETASRLSDLENNAQQQPIPEQMVQQAEQTKQQAGTLTRNKQIPSSEEMRAGASAIYKDAAQRGGLLPPETTNKILDIFKGEEPKTATEAIAAKSDPVKQFYEEYKSVTDKPLTLDDVQTLDEALGDKIDSEYTLGRISKAGLKLQKAQNSFRDMIDNLQENSISGGKEGFNALKDARKAWSASRKMSDVERIINRAQGMDQPANAIRSGMNSLLNNPSRLKGFTKEEISAIRQASKTGVVGGLLRIFGSRLVPIGTGVAGFVGGAGLGGIPATIATAALSKLARTGALSLQEKRTNALKKTIANPYTQIQSKRSKLVAPEVKASMSKNTAQPELNEIQGITKQQTDQKKHRNKG